VLPLGGAHLLQLVEGRAAARLVDRTGRRRRSAAASAASRCSTLLLGRQPPGSVRDVREAAVARYCKPRRVARGMRGAARGLDSAIRAAWGTAVRMEPTSHLGHNKQPDVDACNIGSGGRRYSGDVKVVCPLSSSGAPRSACSPASTVPHRHPLAGILCRAEQMPCSCSDIHLITMTSARAAEHGPRSEGRFCRFRQHRRVLVPSAKRRLRLIARCRGSRSEL